MSAPIAVTGATGSTILPFTSSISNPWLVVVPVGMRAKASIPLLSELAREAGEAQPVGNADRPQAFLVDMLVAIGAALLDEHDLVDAGLLVAGQMRAQLVGGTDAATPGIVRQLGSLWPQRIVAAANSDRGGAIPILTQGPLAAREDSVR